MPLDPKLTKFTTASQAIASFDFQDIEEGTGYNTFFLAAVRNVATNEYLLTTQAIASQPQFKDFGSSSGVTLSDETFVGSPFNLARTIRGTFIFEGQFILRPGQAGSMFINSLILKHTSGEVTTNLVSLSSTTPDEEFTMSGEIAKTLIKKGDFLSLFIEVSVTKVTGTTYDLQIDPLNLLASGDFGARCRIPFVIDI